MDAGLLWTVIGSAAGVLGAALVAWQVRLQVAERREVRLLRDIDQQLSSHDAGGLPVAVPLGRLPAEIRGRDGLRAELRRPLGRRPHPRRSGRTWVLAGMGGLGKSTMALATAQTARARGWRVWWVTATDTASLTGGMLEVLRQLRAPETVIKPVREGAPAAADRAWEYLNGPHPAGRRWLLIFDNADTPDVLAAPGQASPADHAGWLRPDPSGMVIVTTRNKDPRTWGHGITIRELAPLGKDDAAKILADLAPGVRDPGGSQARELGRRLGGLPLALHLAGSYLASPFARWHTFAEYHHALDSVHLPAALADLDEPLADARTAIQRTWDLSLDGLAAGGQPQARPLLLLLSCYAPATPIPTGLLQPQPLASLLTAGSEPSVGDPDERQRRLRSGLHGLASVGLIDITGGGQGDRQAVTVHPVVADANRARLQTTAPAAFPGIGEAAVRQVQAAASELDGEHPADWPAWHGLMPHVLALLEWLAAHLRPAEVADLLTVSSRAADALVRSGNSAAAEKLARSGVAVLSRLDGDDPAALTARYALAAALEGRCRDKDKDAGQLYQEVLADQRRVLGSDHPDVLATRYGLARSVGHGRYGQAERLYRELLADQQRILGADHPRTLMTRHALARTTGQLGRTGEAEQMYSQVLSDMGRVLGDDHPDTLAARHSLAWVTGRHGRYADAEQQHRQVLADQRRVLGDDHPHTLGSRHDLAWSIAKQGRSREAERLYRQVLADQQRVMGDDHPVTLNTRLNLTEAIAAQGRHQEAEHLYCQLISDQQRPLGEDHPITLETSHGLAQVITLQGRPGQAEQLYRQVLASRQRVLGDHHPATLTTSHMLAQVTAGQGRYAEAGQLLRQVLTEREQLLGKDHPDTQSARQDLERITRPHQQATS
jgi:tetratricopeptide (TPR) repeat protein